MTARPRPSPTALTRPFWEATRENRLVLQRCDDCGAFRWTPQILCVKCHGEAYTWTPVSGRGVLYSFTVVYRAPLAAFTTPYVVAEVRLEEGPLMLTNLVECDFEQIRIDMPVEVTFVSLGEDMNVYCFRPCSSPLPLAGEG